MKIGGNVSKKVGGFSRGFSYPFSSLSFINRNPGLFKYIIIPFLINVMVFTFVVYFGFGFFQETVLGRIPQGDAWYWFLLNYFLLAVGIIVILVLVFFSFTVVGNLIAAPFNDILSESTEEILSGCHDDELFSWASFIKEANRSMVNEVKKLTVFAVGMLLLLMLNIMPVIGALLYSVLSVLWIVFFLIVEYTSYVLSRKRVVFVEQRKLIFQNFSTMIGFGAAVLFILAIPFLQFLSIPLGVVGATRMLFDIGMPGQSQCQKLEKTKL